MFKREDLLPYGGGNKVRRFLTWLRELQEVHTQDHDSYDRRLSVAAFSNVGSHTFAVLAKMLEANVYGLNRLLLWERAQPRTPYTEKIRSQYENQSGVSVVCGPSLILTIRWLLARWSPWSTCKTMGIGGAVTTRTSAYHDAIIECDHQLCDMGLQGKRRWHLFPVASGNMADAFLRVFQEKQWTHHRVLGVQTGPWIARYRNRWRYSRSEQIVLQPAGQISWSQYVSESAHFFQQTEIGLDPVHMIHVARLLKNLPKCVDANDVVIVWVTCPCIRRLTPLDD